MHPTRLLPRNLGLSNPALTISYPDLAYLPPIWFQKQYALQTGCGPPLAFQLQGKSVGPMNFTAIHIFIEHPLQAHDGWQSCDAVYVE
jgi:hypothetical protein